MDRLIRGIANGPSLRVAAARTTDSVREAVARHGLAGGAADAMARALTGLALMQVMDKDFYRLSAQWVGRGPIGTVNADVRADGDIRGFVTGTTWAGSVEDGLGSGVMSLIRQKEGGQFTQGQAPLFRRDVDGDLEAFADQSDQVPTTLRVLTRWDDGALLDVVGLMLQELPGATPGAVDAVGAPALLDRSLRWDDGASLEELTAVALPGLPVEWLGETTLRWACPCSAARVQDGVRLLGAAELDEMIATGEEPEVRCDYCTTTYSVNTDALRRIRASLDA